MEVILLVHQLQTQKKRPRSLQIACYPQEGYDFVCSVLEESNAAKEKYKVKYAGQCPEYEALFHCS